MSKSQKRQRIVLLIIIISILMMINSNKQKEYIKQTTMKKMIEGEGVVRIVSNENPTFGEIVNVTLTVTLMDTNSVNDGDFYIEEQIPMWEYNQGNFNIQSVANLLNKLGTNLGGGTYTYYYTITAPFYIDTYQFNGYYGIGENQTHGPHTLITGISSITSQHPTCTLSSDCNIIECKIGTCSSGQCSYSNEINGTICTEGICQYGICTPLPKCIGTTPQNADLCYGDNIGLTQDTNRTLVVSCGTPKCEYTCKSGYNLSNDQCVLLSLCGNNIVDAGEDCDDSIGSASCASLGYGSGMLICTNCAYDVSGCISPECECTSWVPTGICGTGDNSGKEKYTRTCPNNCNIIEDWVSNPTLCPTTIPDACENRCEFYQTCNESTGKCKFAGWVYFVILFMAFMFMMSMIKQR